MSYTEALRIVTDYSIALSVGYALDKDCYLEYAEALRIVDAFCKIPAWSRDKCESYYGLLPVLRRENDRNADVRRVQLWKRSMERQRNLLCLPRTGMDTGKDTQEGWRGVLRE